MIKTGKELIHFLNVTFSDEQLGTISHDEQRRINLTNYISVIVILNMLLYVFIYLILDFQLFQHAIIFLITASVIDIGIIIVNKNGKHLLAKILLSTLTPLFTIYVSTVAFGEAPGFQVYLLVSTIIPLFLWGYPQRKYPAFIISIVLVTYFIIEFFSPFITPSITLPDNYIYYFKLTNVAACFLAAGAAIVVYQHLYRKKEEQLLKQTEELKISQAHKDKVYSIIAHDLRVPFGTFEGLTEIFVNEYNEYSDEKRLETIKSMHKTSASLQNLLENLLDWSRMQSGSLEVSLKQLNLRKIAEESLALHKEVLLKKEQNTEIDIDSNLTIYADHHMISTVFRNLISNAIKFTSQNGKIGITAKENSSTVHICIEDTGIGLSKEDLKNLFDIRNTDKITAPKSEKGSGLGLLLCKDFIEYHKGKLWVESKLGKGSKFCFTLPINRQSTND